MLCECGCGRTTTIAKQTRLSAGIRKGEPNRFVTGHNTQPIEVRFWAQVAKHPTGCWEWLGASNQQGYGQIKWRGKQWRANRLALVLAGVPLTDDHWACHECDNPKCVRVAPGHIYAGTPSDNNTDTVNRDRRAPPKTHCKRGHEMMPGNCLPARPRAGVKRGHRCRICTNALNRASYQRTRGGK